MGYFVKKYQPFMKCSANLRSMRLLYLLVRSPRNCGFVALLASFCLPAQTQAEPHPLELQVMTFNLRYASTNPPNAWPVRRPVMRECLRQSRPDIMGTQEGLYGQIQDLASDLPDYEWIGTGREGGSRGEFAAVFFRRTRFEPMAYDHFWLSDIPNLIGSASWGNKVVRMATLVRLRDRKTGIQFNVINVHMDHQSQKARERSSQLLRERIAAMKDALPILLIGDFNAEPPTNKAYQILVEGDFLKDLWLGSPVKRNDGVETFHDFKGPSAGVYRIDWILGRGNWKPLIAEVITFSRGRQYPSDHFPVMVKMRLN